MSASLSNGCEKFGPLAGLLESRAFGRVACFSISVVKLITGETLYIDGGYHIID
jgi:enoyl-[acyl-carrier-protein] reductase (NADH)